MTRLLVARRHPGPLAERDRVFLVVADHPARGVLKAGSDPLAMADRGELLRRLEVALARPGVDGVLASADIVDDLAIRGALALPQARGLVAGRALLYPEDGDVADAGDRAAAVVRG